MFVICLFVSMVLSQVYVNDQAHVKTAAFKN